jgi:DNA-binding winged helix-turn-helix (wHTH) protein
LRCPPAELVSAINARRRGGRSGYCAGSDTTATSAIDIPASAAPTRCSESAQYRKNQPLHRANRLSAAAAEPSLGFGRFRVLLRQRLLSADGVPIELGARAFELLLALLEADGSLVSKEELLARVWPDTVVTEDNLKVQVFALRRALGKDRDFIHTDFGRGYRFTAEVRSTGAWNSCQRPMRWRHQSTRGLFPQRITRRPSSGWCVQDRFGRHFDPARGEAAASCRD